MLFQMRENIVLLSLGCGKLKALGDLMRILKVESIGRLDAYIECVGS